MLDEGKIKLSGPPHTVLPLLEENVTACDGDSESSGEEDKDKRTREEGMVFEIDGNSQCGAVSNNVSVFCLSLQLPFNPLRECGDWEISELFPTSSCLDDICYPPDRCSQSPSAYII